MALAVPCSPPNFSQFIYKLWMKNRTPYLTHRLRGFEQLEDRRLLTVSAGTVLGTDEGILEDFETGSLDLLPWSTYGDAPWQVSLNDPSSGLFSAQAGSIADNQESVLEFSLFTEQATIQFAQKVSSETSHDYLKFEIDGVELGRWSGESDYSIETYSVSSGTHTFRWTFRKDSSVFSGNDTVYVDDIRILAHSQVGPTSYTIDTFETGDFFAQPWTFDGHAPWVIVQDELTGTFRAQSGNIENNEISALDLTLETESGIISFSGDVSTEQNFDFLRFYIDGEIEGSWSGVDSFSSETFAVDAGTHTFRWAYEKDITLSGGLDTVSIDNIRFLESGDHPPQLAEDDDFESGDFGKLDWRFSGDSDWIVTAEDPYAGSFSVRSGAISRNEVSTLQLTVFTQQGNIQFARKLNDPHIDDHLSFQIDGEELASWSRAGDYRIEQFPVSAGVHTLSWTYHRSRYQSPYSPEDHVAFIDDLKFVVPESQLNEPNNEDFESGDLVNLPWKTEGDSPWLITADTAASGEFSVRSGVIGDSESSSLEIVMPTEAGSIQFARRVSSENNYDHLQFFIDDVLHSRWSGELPFETFAFPVTAGVHTFRWTYEKDSSQSDGLDAVFIDDIVLTPFKSLPLGEPVKGSFENISDSERFEVQVNEQGYLSVSAYTGTTVDPVLQLFDEQGTYLYQSDDANPSETDAVIELFVDPGIYYLVVTPSPSSIEFGIYTIEAEFNISTDPYSTIPLDLQRYGSFYPDSFLPIAIGDLNGDGYADFVVGGIAYTDPSDPQESLRDGYQVYLGSDKGIFQPLPTEGGLGGFFSYDVVAVDLADFNGDMILDLLVTLTLPVSDGPTSYVVFSGRGDGSFSSSPNDSKSLSFFDRRSAVTADLNLDGHSDLVVLGNDFLGSSVQTYVSNEFGGVTQFTVPLDFTSSDFFPELTVEDINGDGLPDVLLGGEELGGLYALIGSEDGGLSPLIPLIIDQHLKDFLIEDFNNDGLQDVVLFASDINTLQIYLGLDDGVLVSAGELPISPLLSHIVGGDFDGDGNQDVATASSDGYIRILYGDGLGNLTEQVVFLHDRNVEALFVHDLDGDTTYDLLLQDDTGVVPFTKLELRQLRFASEINTGLAPGTFVTADVNNDGNLDLISATEALSDGDQSPDLSVALGEGNGKFGTPSLLSIEGRPNALITEDFNRDGRADLAVMVTERSKIEILYGLGDGSFRSVQAVELPFAPTAMESVDFNSDFIPDIAVIGEGLHSLQMLIGSETDGFSVEQAGLLASNPTQEFRDSFETGALNDLLWITSGNAPWSISESNSSTGAFSAGSGVIGHNESSTLELHATTTSGVIEFSRQVSSEENYDFLVFSIDGEEQASWSGTLVHEVVSFDTSPGDHVFRWTYRKDGSVSSPIDQAFIDDIVLKPKDIIPTRMLFGFFDHDLHRDLAIESDDSQILVFTSDGVGGFTLDENWSFSEPAKLFGAIENPSGPDSLLVGEDLVDPGKDLIFQSLESSELSNDNGLPTSLFTYQLDEFLGLRREEIVYVPPSSGSRQFYIQTIAIADINADDRSDLIVGGSKRDNAIPFVGNLAVLAGQTDGSFEILRNENTAYTTLNQVAIADINNDLRYDLIALAQAGFDFNSVKSATVFVGATEGRFEEIDQFTGLGLGQDPILADLDRDGGVDQISLNRSGEILFRQERSATEGRFLPPIVVNREFRATSVTIFQHQSELLIAAIDESIDRLSLYNRNTEGEFARFSSLKTSGVDPMQIRSGDLNGDSLDDLIVVNEGSGSLSLFLANPSGAFSEELVIQVGDTPSSIEIADLNADLFNDIIVTNLVSGYVTLLLNDLQGGFAISSYRTDNSILAIRKQFNGDQSVESTGGPVNVAMDDVDRDGNQDMIIVNFGNAAVSFLRGKGSGAFQDPITHKVSSPPSAARLMDLDGDAIVELILLLPNSNQVAVYSLNGPQHTPDELFKADIGSESTGIEVKDLDRDGRLDLLVTNNLGDILVLHGNGDGTFQSYERTDSNIALAVADIDGDGIQDSILANQSLDGLSIRRGDGGSTFEEVERRNRGDGLIGPGAVEVVDMNGDGFMDIVVANSSSNTVLVYLGLDDGSYGSPQTFFAGTNPKGLSFADFTGDGLLDIVVANQGSNDVTVLLSSTDDKGAWGLTPGPRLALQSSSAESTEQGLGPVSTEITDFNEDGILDLVVANSASDNVFQIPGLGNGFFDDQAPIVLPTGTTPQQVLVGEFDPIPGLDLVTINSGSNDITIYSGFNPNSRLDISSGGDTPIAAIAQDVNDDGSLDLLVANNGDGGVSLLLGGENGLELVNILETGLHPTAIALAALGDELSLLVASEGDELVRVFTPQQYLPTESSLSALSSFVGTFPINLFNSVAPPLFGSSIAATFSPLFVFANTLLGSFALDTFITGSKESLAEDDQYDALSHIVDTLTEMLHEVRKIVFGDESDLGNNGHPDWELENILSALQGLFDSPEVSLPMDAAVDAAFEELLLESSSGAEDGATNQSHQQKNTPEQQDVDSPNDPASEDSAFQQQEVHTPAVTLSRINRSVDRLTSQERNFSSKAAHRVEKETF